MGKGDLVPRIITGFGVMIQCSEQEVFVRAWPVNLSETGACVRLDRPLEPGQTVQLQISMGGQARLLNVGGRITWVRQDSVNQVFYCGMGFVDLSESQLQEIRSFVQQNSETLLQFFSEFPLFADFSGDDCRDLLKIITLRDLNKREILYQEGTSDVDLQGLFIVRSGLLSIFKGQTHTPETQLAVVSAGQIFGEATLVRKQPHTASVMAVNKSSLIQINKVGFQLLRRQQPALALKVMDVVARTLTSRLGRTTKKLFSAV